MNKLVFILLLFAFQASAQITTIINESKEYWDITVFCEGEILYTGVLDPGAQHIWVGYGRNLKIVYKLLTNECGLKDLKSEVFYGQEAGYQNGIWYHRQNFRLFNGPCGPKA